VSYLVFFPLMLRIGLGVGGVSLGELARGAWLPAYSLGAVLAVALVGLRLALDPHDLLTVVALLVGGPLAYWEAYYLLALDEDERALARSLFRRRR